ncbi:nucleoside hydrolase [Tumebacillus flagellatus]|uniref:Inosine/uridine-preferring nucleoside hydrolase domain-containing protein n=1 Tax=Tumebacillus flagellatus TaxID=1157490 RepID=A0A074LRL8_9BACL|nr:nucleoside hydrolase [Tumebacillus flagellatus]KEO83095.1 hypothetical protein EL26_11535 [Tumebacillus flagellatus]
MRRKIILFFDGGVDDAFALWYSVRNPDLDVRGVVGDYGNMPRDIAVRNAKWLLRQLGREDIPVFAGCARPMTGERPVFFPEVHGTQGLGLIELPLVKESAGELHELLPWITPDVTILELGRMTSLATLMLLYGERWKGVQIYAMGGAFGVGNITEVAEANVYGDPVAAQLVLTSGADVTLFPLHVTMKAVLTPEMVSQTPLTALYEPYWRYYHSKNPALSGAPMHDLLPAFALTHQEALGFIRRNVDIVTDNGRCRGQTIADFRPGAKEAAAPAGTRLAWELEGAVFAEDVLRVLQN